MRSLDETLIELRQRFGTVYEVQSSCDDPMRTYVDVRDSSENRHFFQEFKERLKTRFQQIDIWMTTYPIEVI